MKKLPQSSSPGQVLLIVLLTMVVVLTIGLSILSASITDIAITSREEEALRAFSAAEAGIEKVLIAGFPLSGEFQDASFNAQVTNIAEGSKTFIYPQNVSAGDTATVWFVAHDTDESLICSVEYPCFTGNQMRICWAKEGTASDQATTPAIEVSIWYTETAGDYSTTKIAREAIDPNVTRRVVNSFSAPTPGDCSIDGNNFAFQKIIDFSSLNGLQFAHIKFIYNTDIAQSLGTDVNFDDNEFLPSQGKRIESIGTAGEAARKVEVYRLFSALPAIFDFGVFTPMGISK